MMHSETTAREIDLEVKRIIDESLERVRRILLSRKNALIALTERLIEIESIEAEELRHIIDENSSGPMVVPGTDAAVRTGSHPVDAEMNQRGAEA